MSRKIAVVGGGAAGMMAALCAAKAGAFVELYERNDRVGKKLLATGNGKCNFSNINMDKNAYYGSAAVFYEELFQEFGVQETIDLFGQSGMLVKNKNGYLYPFSEQAATVLDVLRFALDKEGVLIHTGCLVDDICVRLKDGKKELGIICDGGGREAEYFDAVVVSCGGMAAPKTGSDGNGFGLAKRLGHSVTKVVPALVQLRCSEDFFKSVAGVRTDARLRLLIDGEEKACERGELQLTDYGISGICVFQFSRTASYALLHKKDVKVEINFFPDYDEDGYAAFWNERWKLHSDLPLENFLTGISNKKINQLVIRLAGLRLQDNAADIPAGTRELIELLYRRLTVSVCGTNGFEHAQVSAGGIPAGELTKELESKLIPNLYFAGEIIDMDGICGGYNLQWAWTSGAVAGRAAAGK